MRPQREQPPALACGHASWGRHYAEERKCCSFVVLNARFSVTVTAGLDSRAARTCESDHLMELQKIFNLRAAKLEESLARFLWLPQNFFYKDEGRSGFRPRARQNRDRKARHNLTGMNPRQE